MSDLKSELTVYLKFVLSLTKNLLFSHSVLQWYYLKFRSCSVVFKSIFLIDQLSVLFLFFHYIFTPSINISSLVRSILFYNYISGFLNKIFS